MNKNLIAARVRYGIARQPDFEALGMAEVRAIKGDDEEIQYRYVDKAVRVLGDREFEHDASTEHRDSMGDVIKVAGWETLRLKGVRIPLLLNHTPHPAPMGVLLSARKDWAAGADRVRALVTRSAVHPPEIYGDSEFGKTVETHFKLMELGIERGVSVGFVPSKVSWPKDQEERDAWNLGPWGMMFEEQELLELSVTCIPANAHAGERKSLDEVKALVTAGTLTQEIADFWLKSTTVHPDEWLEQRCPSIRRKSFAMPAMPEWMKGMRAESAEPVEAGSCCADAKTALAETVRDVIRAEVPAIVREEVRVLRSKNSSSGGATVPTSQADSTIDRGRAAAKAPVAGAAREPGESRRANPKRFARTALHHALQQHLQDRTATHASERDRHRPGNGKAEV